jgi:hypothetical protein
MPIIPHTDRKSVLMRTLTFLPVRQSLSNWRTEAFFNLVVFCT